jgi:hypothetical protein
MVLLEFFFDILSAHHGPGVDSASNRRVPGIFPRGKGGRCLGLTTLPPSCADCPEIWEPVQACNGIALPLSLLHISHIFFFFSVNIMTDVASKQQTTALFLSTTVTRTRRQTELTKTDKPDWKPVLCQRTFSSDFCAVF